jgi:glycosyltransferase involved in cell wall biosynthesis
MKILFLSSWFPIPADNGSKLRIYNLLTGLSKYYEVSLISFADSLITDRNKDEIKSICKEVKTIPFRRFNPNSFKARLGFLSLTPRAFIDTYSPEMAQQIKETIAIQKPDLVIASQLGTALYRQIFKTQPALFEEVEIGMFYERYINAESFISRFRNRLAWMKHRRYLANLLRSYQACTVVSDREKQLLRNIGPNNTVTEIIPNCININGYQAIKHIPQSDTLIFTGSFSYYPNYQAIVWFLEKVFPQIQAYCPSTKLMITGYHGGRPIPPTSNVTLTGYVEDVRPFIARSSVSVVPII